jgi:hypothetical protein
MGLKSSFMAVVFATLLAWSGLSLADEYRAGEVLGLDLAKAALSPKLLGPLSQFKPRPLDVDHGSQTLSSPTEPKTDAAEVSGARPTTFVPRSRVARSRPERPRGVAQTNLARRHGNPLDAQASDTRIQVWPCKSGGICGWQRAAPPQ